MSEPTTQAAWALLARIAQVSDESEYDGAGFRRDLAAIEAEARADRDAEVAALLRPALDEALRPYLDLLLSSPDQNDTIIRGAASRLSSALLAQPEPKP